MTLPERIKAHIDLLGHVSKVKGNRMVNQITDQGNLMSKTRAISEIKIRQTEHESHIIPSMKSRVNAGKS